jgi:hypothetical protein
MLRSKGSAMASGVLIAPYPALEELQVDIEVVEKCSIHARDPVEIRVLHTGVSACAIRVVHITRIIHEPPHFDAVAAGLP